MIEINDSNFEEVVIQSSLPSLVTFKANWCGPCKMLSPIIDQINTDFIEKAVVVKLDVEENPETAAKYSIRNIPVMLFIKDGEVVDKIVGATTKSNIVEKLNKLI